MHSLSIFGTSSDAGKSTLAFALTYLLHQRGIKVAPFKAQNVSNNSQVCDSGGEIAIPQHFAAEAIGLKTTPDMNPILLKSGSGKSAHMIIDGKSVGEKDVWSYYRDINSLKPYVKKAFKNLQKEYECIVAEGAGSPVELNLMQKDLSNIYIAQKFQTKIVLVADIERGGVFASIYGVYKLLPKELQKNVTGVIVNKFRGDITLFDEGVRIIEEEFGLRVFGVVPYKPFNLGFEDSQSLMNYTQNKKNPLLRVGVIALPHISNFTDFEPLVVDAEIELTFLHNALEAERCDVLIIPGSKRVVDDLAWLREKGFQKQLKKKMTIGICGGYEMLHETIIDEHHLESSETKVKALGIFQGSITFKEEKIVKKGSYKIFSEQVQGYEIHNGVSDKCSQRKKHYYGTFVHGIFESDALREKLFRKIDTHYVGYNFKKYKKEAIASYAKHIEQSIDVDAIVKALDA